MTGLSPQNRDRVIEIGAVAIEGQRIVDEFSNLIDVDNRISRRIQQVHGTTNEMLSGEPKPDAVLPQFYKFIAGNILVAHNAWLMGSGQVIILISINKHLRNRCFQPQYHRFRGQNWTDKKPYESNPLNL